MSFVWIIRQWCSLDSYWEHVRENKDFDVAYKSPEFVLNEIKRIVEKEEIEWKQRCSTSDSLKESDREFGIDIPSLEQVVNRPFIKFLTISTTGKSNEYWQSWYVERMTIV
jgi:hypothetical protein